MCKQLVFNWLFTLTLANVVFAYLGEAAEASILGATAELSNGNFVEPTDMFLADGNDVGGNLEQTLQMIFTEFGCELGLTGKTDDSNCGPFTFSPSDSSGYLALDEVTDGPLVLTLKAGNGCVAFLFVEDSIVGFEFDTEKASLTNKRGKGLHLGHASLFANGASPPSPPPPSPPPPSPPSTSVPEPGSLVLLGGLLLTCACFKSFRWMLAQ